MGERKERAAQTRRPLKVLRVCARLHLAGECAGELPFFTPEKKDEIPHCARVVTRIHPPVADTRAEPDLRIKTRFTLSSSKGSLEGYARIAVGKNFADDLHGLLEFTTVREGAGLEFNRLVKKREVFAAQNQHAREILFSNYTIVPALVVQIRRASW